MEDAILKFVGEVVAIGGGATVVAYGIFRIFGEKWLDNKFSKQIENHKHNLNSLFNRVVIVQEKEFEVLLESWKLLQMAWGHIATITSSLINFPNLDNYPEEELKVFLKESQLHEYQKKNINKSNDKLKLYQSYIFWIELREAITKTNNFRNYITLNKIFIEENLFINMSEISQKLYKIINHKSLMYPTNSHVEEYGKLQNDISKTIEEINPLIPVVEGLVKERLKFKEA